MSETNATTVALTHDDPNCSCCDWCLWMWAYCPIDGCEHTNNN